MFSSKSIIINNLDNLDLNNIDIELDCSNDYSKSII